MAWSSPLCVELVKGYKKNKQIHYQDLCRIIKFTGTIIVKGQHSITFRARGVMSCHKQRIRWRILHYPCQHFPRNHYFNFCHYRVKEKGERGFALEVFQSLGFQGQKEQRIKSSLTLPWQGWAENGGSPVAWCVKRTQWDSTNYCTLEGQEMSFPNCGQMARFFTCFVLNVCFKMKWEAAGGLTKLHEYLKKKKGLKITATKLGPQ